MKTILVLTDFSIASRRAAEAGMHIALKLKAQLLLLNSYHLPQIILTEPPEKDYFELGLEHKKRLDRERYRLMKIMASDDEKKMTIKTIGSIEPMAEILDDIQQGYSIILTVTGRHKSLANSFLNANHIQIALAHSGCPLLIVTPSAFKKVLLRANFASDLDPKDLPLAYHLYQLAKIFDSHLCITHVLGDTGLIADFNQEDKLKAFSLALKSESFDGVDLSMLEGSSVVSAEYKRMSKKGFDLLVLVNRRHAMLHELFHPSRCKAFIKNQKVPILIMPEDWNGKGCKGLKKKQESPVNAKSSS